MFWEEKWFCKQFMANQNAIASGAFVWPLAFSIFEFTLFIPRGSVERALDDVAKLLRLITFTVKFEVEE